MQVSKWPLGAKTIYCIYLCFFRIIFAVFVCAYHLPILANIGVMQPSSPASARAWRSVRCYSREGEREREREKGREREKERQREKEKERDRERERQRQREREPSRPLRALLWNRSAEPVSCCSAPSRICLRRESARVSHTLCSPLSSEYLGRRLYIYVCVCMCVCPRYWDIYI